MPSFTDPTWRFEVSLGMPLGKLTGPWALVLRRNRPHSVGSEGSCFGESRAGQGVTGGQGGGRHGSFPLQHVRLTKKYGGGLKSEAPVPFFSCVPRCDHFVDAPTGYKALNIEAFFFFFEGGR